MKAINLYRRRRALRFGAMGLGIGATIYFSLLLVLNFFTLFLRQDFFPRTTEDVYTVVVGVTALAAAFGSASFIIGALTARIPARVWAWRVFGIAIACGSVGLFIWTWIIATPDAFGWAMVGFVCIAGVLTGTIVYTSAKDKAIEGL